MDFVGHTGGNKAIRGETMKKHRLTVAALILLVLWPAVSMAQYEIFVASNRGDLKEVKALLRREPTLAYAKSKGGFTPLHMASINGHAEVAEVLIDAGTDINARNLEGVTSISKAVQGNYPELVRLLIEKGADVNLKDDSGTNPILIAEMEGYTNITALLLPVSDVNVSTAGGATPLHMAASRGLGDIQSLLDRGAMVNVADNRGWTPLHVAAAGGNMEAVRILLEAGADRTIKNKRGETASDLARKKGRREVADAIDGFQAK